MAGTRVPSLHLENWVKQDPEQNHFRKEAKTYQITAVPPRKKMLPGGVRVPGMENAPGGELQSTWGVRRAFLIHLPSRPKVNQSCDAPGGELLSTWGVRRAFSNPPSEPPEGKPEL